MQGSFSYSGFILGTVAAIIIGYFIFVQGKKVDLTRFFKYTTLFLVFIASGMIAYGTHELEEYFVKSNKLQESSIQRPWNVLPPVTSMKPDQLSFLYTFNNSKGTYIHLLHDKGHIGVFLKGFFGYNSNPNYIELLFWLASLSFGLVYWYNLYFKLGTHKA